MATPMSPSTLIFPCMKAAVGSRSPATSDSSVSRSQLIVQSASRFSVVTVFGADAPSTNTTPSFPQSNLTVAPSPELSPTRLRIFSAADSMLISSRPFRFACPSQAIASLANTDNV